MSTKTGEVVNQIEQKPKRKANVIYKTDKPMDADEQMDNASGSGKIETFQQQALEIREPGPDFDPTAPPKDGEEYLMHMLYERKQCPAVMVQEPDKVVKTAATELTENFKDQEMPLKSIPMPCKRPTKEWKEFQLADFEQSRAKTVLLRMELHRQQYDQALEPPLTSDASAWRKFCQEHQPLLRIVLRFSQRTLEQLLEYICEWLREGEEIDGLQKPPTPTDDAKPSTSNAACSMITAAAEQMLDLTDKDAWIGTWLYATLSCLHIPIEPEVHSTLRDIARVCIRLRGRVPKSMAGKAVPYNLFIVLVAGAFGQRDFADFV